MAGVQGAQGLGQGIAQNNQFPMQGVGGSPQPMGVNLPQSVQRMPGGFGLSPQLLSMIAGLQSRNPQFTPQQPPQTGFFGNGLNRPTQIANPYQSPYAKMVAARSSGSGNQQGY